MSKILRLDPHMANLIAAGEVVERPSSVVKELVENAIDASSTKITVELIDAGTKSITVTDNGTGMDEEDAVLAFERHATSKIKLFDDLYRIRSLGFRGEALPSIASVSEVILTTSTDSLNGTKVLLKAGVLVECSKTSAPVGTKVIVNHLFYNTPARFKHISSQSTELSYSIDYINKCALAFPTIRFTLMHNDKVILHTSGNGDLLEAIADTYGIPVAKHMVEFSAKESHFAISGYASDNSITRSNRYGMTVLVNGRVIKNRSFVYAITDAYKHTLVTGKFPIVVLNITVDPSLIDVNIHPSKFEIKVTDEDQLKSFITTTITNALSKQVLIPEMNLSKLTERPEEHLVKTTLDPILEPSRPNILSMFEEPSESSDEAEPFVYSHEQTPSIIKESEVFTQIKLDELLPERTLSLLPQLEYIGQFHGTYLLAQDEQVLYLIDQHAAMERVMYEKISAQLNMQEISIYELLIPFQLHFSLSEYALVLEQKELLLTLGVEIEEFGSGTILVRKIPSWIYPKLVEEFVRDMIEQLITSKHTSKSNMLDSIAKNLSCKQSIKANMYVTKEEVKVLLQELNQAKSPFTCPHGRPVIVKLSTYDIEKWFKRVV